MVGAAPEFCQDEIAVASRVFGTERACSNSIEFIAASEQVWPGRAILEYDSGIQSCEGRGPNFNFF
jgi:hypothetical protein